MKIKQEVKKTKHKLTVGNMKTGEIAEDLGGNLVMRINFITPDGTQPVDVRRYGYRVLILSLAGTSRGDMSKVTEDYPIARILPPGTLLEVE